jgi:hypothetical protein
MPMVEVLPLLFSHIPVKPSEDLLSNAVEVIWLEVHVSPKACYKPPSADRKYLDNMF